MNKLIEVMAKSLVDAPEEVVVTEKKGVHTSMFVLRVARGDAGKVIGKDGQTAQAMRTILEAASAKLKRRCVLEIVDYMQNSQGALR